MKKFRFKCNKITHEEKNIQLYGEPKPIFVHFVDVQFSCIDTIDIEPINHSYFHGYLALTLPVEIFNELRYEIGKIYELTPT